MTVFPKLKLLPILPDGYRHTTSHTPNFQYRVTSVIRYQMYMYII